MNTTRPSRKLDTPSFIIASHNQGKIREISSYVADYNIVTQSSASLKLEEPEETGATYFENALLKARSCSLLTGKPALGDDSGIEVFALEKKPGLHTSRYTHHHGGLVKVFAQWMSNKDIIADPRAQFFCVQIMYWPDGHYECFEGIVEGRLIFPPRGDFGHGYDPIFIPNGHSLTLAQMEKNTCGHRAMALRKFVDACIL